MKNYGKVISIQCPVSEHYMIIYGDISPVLVSVYTAFYDAFQFTAPPSQCLMEFDTSIRTYKRSFLSIITSSNSSIPLPPFSIILDYISFTNKSVSLSTISSASSFDVYVKSLLKFRSVYSDQNLHLIFLTAINESRCYRTPTQVLGCKKTTVFVKLTTSTSNSMLYAILFIYYL